MLSSTFQDFFNNNPALAGIIVFLVIAIIVVILWFIFFKISQNIKNKPNYNDYNNSNTNQTIENDDKKSEFVLDENIIYYQLNFDRSGKLIIKNINKKDVNNDPKPSDFDQIFLNLEAKLLLPEDYIEITRNENQNTFMTSKPPLGKDLFIYNSFLKFMEQNLAPWAISKFK